MTRVVLDTNVLVSAIIRPPGKPAQILRQAFIRYRLLTCRFILSELVDVLARKHIQTKYDKLVTSKLRVKFIEKIHSLGKVVETRTFLDAVSDPKDNPVLACAVDGRADYLVTGDPHLLKLGIFSDVRILTPTQFLQILETRK